MADMLHTKRQMSKIVSLIFAELVHSLEENGFYCIKFVNKE